MAKTVGETLMLREKRPDRDVAIYRTCRRAPGILRGVVPEQWQIHNKGTVLGSSLGVLGSEVGLCEEFQDWWRPVEMFPPAAILSLFLFFLDTISILYINVVRPLSHEVRYILASGEEETRGPHI